MIVPKDQYVSKKEAERNYMKMKEKSERLLLKIKKGELKNPYIDFRELFKSDMKNKALNKTHEEENKNV